MSRVTLTAGIFLMALSAVAYAQEFDNGNLLGCREGFINLRTDLDGVPNDPNEGKEVLKMTLPSDASWTVKINPKDADQGYLRFQGSSANTQVGTGSILVTLTSIKQRSSFLTIDVTTSSGTSHFTPKVTSFILKPEYESQPNKIVCSMEIGGAPGDGQGAIRGEVHTNHRPTPVRQPEVAFDDVARACIVDGNVTSSGNVRISKVTSSFGSRFRIVSEPTHECLTGKDVKANFTAKESFWFDGVKVHCELFSGGGALWKLTDDHITSATGVTAPGEGVMHAESSCPSGIGNPQDPDDSLANAQVQTRGVTQPQEATFKLNDTVKKFYEVHDEVECRASGAGSSSVGTMYYETIAFVVRIVPKPLF